MRWTLVALVISCAHDKPPPPEVQVSPPVSAADVESDEDADVVDAADAFDAADADDARPRWHALLDGIELRNVEHVMIEPLAPSAGVQMPRVRIGDVRTSDLIDPHVALRVLRSRLMAPKACYELELRKAPDLDKVRVKLRLAILASGDVAFAEASSPSAPESLLRCLERVSASITLPPPSALAAIETTILLDQPRR